ncbi:MAG: hypothetical protein D3908_13680, partial [Candidatus Electrothrix sp. AUS4]|nr:hypothetical protein [Candidatus Electrothrix sp. AUS4]
GRNCSAGMRRIKLTRPQVFPGAGYVQSFFQRHNADESHLQAGSRNRVLLHRFPYSIIYHPSVAELIVVSCFHHKRKPGSWSNSIA